MLNRFSCVQLFGTLWTVAHQASLSMGFSRQEYWSGLPCPPPGDLPDPGIEPVSLALQADSLPLSHWRSPFNVYSILFWYTYAGAMLRSWMGFWTCFSARLGHKMYFLLPGYLWLGLLVGKNIVFLLVFPMLLVSYWTNHCPDQYKEAFPFCFLLGVSWL